MFNTDDQNQKLKSVLNQIDKWYEANDVGLLQQYIHFYKTSDIFDAWLKKCLIPSLMDGDKAYGGCVEDIYNESNEVLKYTKYLAASTCWNSLDAPPNDVAKDLLAQGWDNEMMYKYITSALGVPRDDFVKNENILVH